MVGFTQTLIISLTLPYFPSIVSQSTSQGTTANKDKNYSGFPSPDEYNNIIKTREDIERLEGCGLPPSDGSGLINPRDPEQENKECDGKTVGELVRLEAIKMAQKEREKIFASTVEGIKTLNSYADICEFVEIKMKASSPSKLWLTFVGAKKAFNGNVKSSANEYIIFALGELAVHSFTTIARTTPTSPGTTPRPNITPSPLPSSSSFDGEPNVQRSDFEDSVSSFVTQSLKQAVRSGASNGDKVCTTVVNKLAIRYEDVVEPRSWMCLAGPSSSLGFKAFADEIPTIVIKMGNTKIQLMKIPKMSKSDFEVLAETRLNMNEVAVNNTDMDEGTANYFVQLAQEGVKEYSSYAGISKHIQENAGRQYQRKFHCTVGLDTQYWIHFWYKKPFLINFKINELRVIAYAQM